MSAFRLLSRKERQEQQARIEYWQQFQNNLEAERKAAMNRHSHKSHFWVATMLIAGCIGIGYVIGVVWGNV